MLQTRSTEALQHKYLKNSYFLLFLIVLFGLILRLIFFSGMNTSDDLAYSKYAVNIDKGIDMSGALTLSVRIGIIYATAFFYYLFGVSDFSSALFPLLTSIGGIILIFYFGRLLFSDKVGLMAAFLLSFFPLDVVYATKLLTDLPSAFFMALGVYSFLYSEKKENKISRFRHNIGYILSGIFIGIGYMIKESVLLIGLFFLVYVIYKRKIKKEYFLVALGFVVVFAVESIVFYKLTGDYLFRSNTSQDYLAAAMKIHKNLGRSSFISGFFYYPYIILTSNLISYFYVFISIAIIYCLAFKKKEAYVMIFWFLSLILYLSVGTSSFLGYIPFKADPRYLPIITAPGLLILSYFLLEKMDIIKKTIMPSIVAILLLSSIGFVYTNGERHGLDNLKEAYAYLKALNKPIYTDQRSKEVFDYFSGYKENSFKEFNRYENPFYNGDRNSLVLNLSLIKNAYIVINNKMVSDLLSVHPGMKFPNEVYYPRNEWNLAKEIGKKPDDIAIYYSP